MNDVVVAMSTSSWLKFTCKTVAGEYDALDHPPLARFSSRGRAMETPHLPCHVASILQRLYSDAYLPFQLATLLKV
jgi:hypothetical protein